MYFQRSTFVGGTHEKAPDDSYSFPSGEGVDPVRARVVPETVELQAILPGDEILRMFLLPGSLFPP